MDQWRWVLWHTWHHHSVIVKYLVTLITTFLLVGCTSIPSVVVSADDPLLSVQSGMTYFEAEPFDGYVLHFYADGALKSRTPYRDGQRDGTKLGYYPTGELMYERLYDQGQKDGKHCGFYPDGAPRFVYHFDEGLSVGRHEEWYQSGQPAKLMNFEEGRPYGEQKVWRSDGKLRANYVIREDGRRYGLVGMKRCKNLDIESETIKPLTTAIYDHE